MRRREVKDGEVFDIRDFGESVSSGCSHDRLTDYPLSASKLGGPVQKQVPVQDKPAGGLGYKLRIPANRYECPPALMVGQRHQLAAAVLEIYLTICSME